MPDTENHKLRVIETFVGRLQEKAAQSPLTVFVCGPSPATGTENPGATLRDFVTKKINGRGWSAFWAEHPNFRKAGRNGWVKRINDADKEILFATSSADLIVIFPASPGSFAELGAFSVHNAIAGKMLVIFDKKYRNDNGFLIKALSRAARTRNATIKFRDYSNPDNVWKVIKTKLEERQIVRVTSESNVTR